MPLLFKILPMYHSKTWVVSEGSFLNWMNHPVNHLVFVEYLLEITHPDAVGDLREKLYILL